MRGFNLSRVPYCKEAKDGPTVYCGLQYVGHPERNHTYYMRIVTEGGEVFHTSYSLNSLKVVL